MHKYTIENYPNDKIILYISFIAIGSALVLSVLLIKLINIGNLPITITITAPLIFTIIYFSLNYIIGRFKWISNLFRIPSLRGDWVCTGKSFNYTQKGETEWKGTISIEQTWSKILVTLKTEKSSSFSTSILANLKKIAGNGYLLTYIYENDPNSDQHELAKHKGVCDIMFEGNLKKASANYFNKERPTFGTMNLRRK